MGTFAGHSGLAFVYFGVGIWCLSNIFRRYYWAKKSHLREYSSSCFYPYRGVPMEQSAIGLITIAGIIGDIWSNYPNLQLHNYHHFAMYVAFLLAVLVFLLDWKTGMALPPNSTYALLSWAAGLKSISLFFHAHRGVPPIETTMHVFACIALGGMVLSLIWEAASPKSVLAALTRGYMTTLFGIWFCHGAWLIYTDSWSGQVINATDMQVMMITAYFAFDCSVALILVLLIGLYQYSQLKDLKCCYDEIMDENRATTLLLEKSGNY